MGAARELAVCLTIMAAQLLVLVAAMSLLADPLVLLPLACVIPPVTKVIRDSVGASFGGAHASVRLLHIAFTAVALCLPLQPTSGAVLWFLGMAATATLGLTAGLVVVRRQGRRPRIAKTRGITTAAIATVVFTATLVLHGTGSSYAKTMVHATLRADQLRPHDVWVRNYEPGPLELGPIHYAAAGADDYLLHARSACLPFDPERGDRSERLCVVCNSRYEACWFAEMDTSNPALAHRRSTLRRPLSSLDFAWRRLRTGELALDVDPGGHRFVRTTFGGVVERNEVAWHSLRARGAPWSWLAFSCAGWLLTLVLAVGPERDPHAAASRFRWANTSALTALSPAAIAELAHLAEWL